MRTDLWSSERDDSITAMWANGCSGTEIGKALGISRAAVLGRIRRLGLTREANPSLGWKLYDQNGVTLRRLSIQKRGVDAEDWSAAATSDAHAHERAKAAAKQAGQS